MCKGLEGFVAEEDASALHVARPKDEDLGQSRDEHWVPRSLSKGRSHKELVVQKP